MASQSSLRPGEIKDILFEKSKPLISPPRCRGSRNGPRSERRRRPHLRPPESYGWRNARGNSSLNTGEKITALALNLEEDNIGAVILGDYLQLKEGDEVRRTARVLEVPVGPELIGRVVDVTWLSDRRQRPGQREEHAQGRERSGSEIIVRSPVQGTAPDRHQGGSTRWIPIGRGQRELIIGDRGTGKTAIAIDTIINQKGNDVICVYVAIGQKASTVAGVVEKLKSAGAMEYTIVVVASASDPAPMQYIAPYTGAAMVEFFMYNEGKATLAVYDDLSKQAAAYRQLSLVLRRPPGREAFPGDVFYLHSRLLERAAKLSEDPSVVDGKTILKPGGSMTALPIIETQAGDVSAYIPTNVISITDGQIFLEADLFYSGVRPAVNVGISVSRVGGSAQTKAMKGAAGRLRLDLAAQYRELEAFSAFASGPSMPLRSVPGSSCGARTVEGALKRNAVHASMTMESQVMILYAVTNGFIDDVDTDKVRAWAKGFHEYMKAQFPQVADKIRTGEAKGISRHDRGGASSAGSNSTRRASRNRWPRGASSRGASNPSRTRARSRARWR